MMKTHAYEMHMLLQIKVGIYRRPIFKPNQYFQILKQIAISSNFCDVCT